MNSPQKPDRARATAAILLWHSRYRLLLILTLGVVSLALKSLGTLTIDSVASHRFGEGAALLMNAGLLAAYVAFIGGLALYMRRTRAIGSWAIGCTLAADVLVFNGTVFLATPPYWYARALILATFTLQLTLLYFGWRMAAWNLLGFVAGHAIVLFVASGADPTMPLVESLWTLGMFIVAVAAFLSLQAELGDRLAEIVQVFDRARDGDFSLTFDERSETQPERITVIGAAYDKMRTQLTSVILTDPLTGCYNARGFDQLSAREVSRAVRADSTLAMLALDLDFFKEINDRYGHLVGDDVLRETGVVLRQTARLTDVVARTGGEEFAILAPDTDEHGAMLFATRIVDAFRAHNFPHLTDRKVTISVGVAFASARTEGVARLLRIRADEALYVAKRAGRNRAEAWREGRATRASQMELGAVRD